ncbi:MAG TPA: hypothetical protein VMZ00_01710 [Sporichthya sp.]|nr:hypothetical protein [Sporichthya sp.]
MKTSARFLGATVAALLVVGAAPVAATTEAKRAPLITLAIYDDESHWIGPMTVGTGPVQFEITATPEDNTLSVIALRPGYTKAQLKKDSASLRALTTGGSKSDVKAVRRLQSNVTTYGGVEKINAGTPVKATIVLEPGSYVLTDNLGYRGEHWKKFTVTDKPNGARMPKFAAEITMTGKKKFGGATSMPHLGTVKMTNRMTSGTRWYVAALYWVEPGTTPKQVSDFVGGRSEDTSWYKGFLVGGDTLSPGHSQLLNFGAAPGRYALVCYFPDLDKPGTTFAGNGMVRMITLT